MLAALIIVFREVFEAGLIVGIVLAVTRAVPHRGMWIGGGIAGGVAGACLVAVFAGALSQLFAGMGQELFNAAILAVAVVMLTWHNVWMASHGRQLAGEMKAVGEEVASGKRSLLALAVVVGVAVMREGSEVVLFLYGILASEGASATALMLGGMAGLALGAGVCVLTYLGLVQIRPRMLFATTTVLITLLAAGMAAQATAFLERANWVSALTDTAWDSSWLLSEDGLLGKTLHTLVGYTEQPSYLQVIVYAATIAITIALMTLTGRNERRPAHGVAKHVAS